MNQGVLGYPGRVEGVQGIAGEVRNLAMKANTGTPITKLDVSLDDCLVASMDGRVRSIGAQSLTANYAFNGLNGLDLGAAAAASWYYVWVIWNEWQAGLLLSLSSSSPQMPAGFTHKGLVGESMYDGTTALRGFVLYFPGRKEFRLTATGGLTAADVESVFTHRLGQVPGMVQVRLVCGTGEFGYSAGDELDGNSCVATLSGTNVPVFSVDATTVHVVVPSGYGQPIRAWNKTTFAVVTLTLANWNWKVIAST